MNEQALVSIVTPCYNAEAFLPRFFDSIIQQTYRPIELVVVNDGSTDQSEKVIKDYLPLLEDSGIKTIFKSYVENQGQAYALNIGLKCFTGEYLSWIDCDDKMTSDCIRKKVDFLVDHKNIDYCVCNTQILNSTGSQVVEIRKPEVLYDSLKIFESLLFNRKGYFVCGAYMVRTAFFEKCVPDRDIYTGRGGQNAQMLLPISWSGRIGYLNEELYQYFLYAESHSHSKNTPKKQIEQLRNFEKILINTLERITDQTVKEYIPKVKRHYSRARFGYSLDTYDSKIIKQCYREMRDTGEANGHDLYLLMRFTNPILRKVFPVQKVN